MPAIQQAFNGKDSAVPIFEVYTRTLRNEPQLLSASFFFALSLRPHFQGSSSRLWQPVDAKTPWLRSLSSPSLLES